MLLAALLLVAAVGPFATACGGPWLFDDRTLIVDNPLVQFEAERADRAELWLDGRSLAAVAETPFELKIPFRQLKYGRHQLTARAERDGRVGMREAFF